MKKKRSKKPFIRYFLIGGYDLTREELGYKRAFKDERRKRWIVFCSSKKEWGEILKMLSRTGLSLTKSPLKREA